MSAPAASMSALKAHVSKVRPRAPLLPLRRMAAAPPRRLLATASKQNAATPPAVFPGKLAKVSEVEKRAVSVLVQSLVCEVISDSAVIKDLLAKVASLERRVLVLEREQQLEAERKRMAEEQQKQLKEEQQKKLKAEQRSRARQLNPACKDYWTSRGYEHAPWTWEEFEDTALAVAHEWPRVVEALRRSDYDNILHFSNSEFVQKYRLPTLALSTLYEMYGEDDVFG